MHNRCAGATGYSPTKEALMRKCVVLLVAALAILSFSLATEASAQSVFLGAGATIPSGDYGDYADVGWIAEAGISFPVGEQGIFLFADGLYGSNSHSDHEGDKTNLLGGFAGIEKAFMNEDGAGPFIFAEVGFLRHSYRSDEHSEWEEDDTGLAFGGGAGYGLPLGENLNGWILGRYIRGQYSGDEGYEDWNTAFFGVMAGVSIQVGG
jgi:hypothetical protein